MPLLDGVEGVSVVDGGWSKVSGVMWMLRGLKLMEGLFATADSWGDAEGCSGSSSGEHGGRQAGGGGSAVQRPVKDEEW